MNVEGADVERRLGRTIMPRFHAGFSLGTVAGAGLGALCTAIEVAPAWHIPAAVVLSVAIVVRSAGAAPPVEETEHSPARRSALAAWREPRTLLIGLMVLSLALTEGTANDWLAVALVDGYDAAHWIAVTGFGAFVAAMTLGRWFGPILLDRHGRVAVLWGTMVAAGVGVLLVGVRRAPGRRRPGIVLWGLGASLGFPVGMSAAADDPAHAAARVSVVSTVGYAAFLGGPPFIGFVADHVGTLKALLVVAVLLVPSALVVPAARQRERRRGLARIQHVPGACWIRPKTCRVRLAYAAMRGGGSPRTDRGAVGWSRGGLGDAQAARTGRCACAFPGPAGVRRRDRRPAVGRRAAAGRDRNPAGLRLRLAAGDRTRAGATRPRDRAGHRRTRLRAPGFRRRGGHPAVRAHRVRAAPPAQAVVLRTELAVRRGTERRGVPAAPLPGTLARNAVRRARGCALGGGGAGPARGAEAGRARGPGCRRAGAGPPSDDRRRAGGDDRGTSAARAVVGPARAGADQVRAAGRCPRRAAAGSRGARRRTRAGARRGAA